MNLRRNVSMVTESALQNLHHLLPLFFLPLVALAEKLLFFYGRLAE